MLRVLNTALEEEKTSRKNRLSFTKSSPVMSQPDSSLVSSPDQQLHLSLDQNLLQGGGEEGAGGKNQWCALKMMPEDRQSQTNSHQSPQGHFSLKTLSNYSSHFSQPLLHSAFIYIKSVLASRVAPSSLWPLLFHVRLRLKIKDKDGRVRLQPALENWQLYSALLTQSQ